MSSYCKKNIENIFEKENAISLRKALIDGVNFLKPLNFSKAFYIVINPSDRCPVACPNCLYSSMNSLKNKAFITKSSAIKMAKIMTDAMTKMVIFSGGGESLENIIAIREILEKTKTLTDCIIITSGYFAQTEISTKKVLDKIFKSAKGNRVKRGLNPICITIRISYDNDHCIKIPIQNIANIVNYVRDLNDDMARVLIRTILSKNENRDSELAKYLKMEIAPSKNTNRPFENLPVIDGLPCRWLRDIHGDFSIPVIYKPIYFMGRGRKNREKRNWSYLNVIESERKSGSKFNLCLRGKKGEGHNYYETLFLGYAFWKRQGKMEYNIRKNDEQKELALYLPADERLAINNGAPDVFIFSKDIKSWNHFLNFVCADPVQRCLIEDGPLVVQNIAREVRSNLDKEIKKANFVFSISSLSLDSPAVRLYVTIRLLQKMYKIKQISVKKRLVHDILSLPLTSLKKAFYYKLDDHKPNASSDPILGNEKSLFYV